MSNRRAFVKKAMTGTASFILGTESVTAANYDHILGANERIGVGGISLETSDLIF